MVGGEMLQLSGILLLVAVSATVARLVLWQSMRAIGPPTGTKAARQLAPAEFAYLLRDGDMGHTLIVMSVDMIQREVKSGDNYVPPPMRSYEKQVWQSVKEFLKALAEQKAGHIVPVGDIKNPMKWAVRINAIKKFVGETLRSFVAELLEDPRHIKKYFSAAGVARLAVYFYTSGVRSAVEKELRQELLAEGFLVPEPRRRQFASLVLALAPCAVIATVVAAYTMHTPGPILLPILGGINAVVLRLICELPGFIPTYEEFAKVSAELKRGSFRLNVVRAILKAGRGVLALLLVLASLILLALELLFVNVATHIGFAEGALLTVAYTIVGFSIVACILDWHALMMREHATAFAEHEMKLTRESISRLRPISTFKQLFSDPDYDPTFSQVVALYGIETLWLLS